MIKIYHDQNFPPILKENRTFPDGFVLVAEVLTNNIGAAFALTNHVDREWWLNEEVTRIGPETRSTSVGDIAVLDDGTVHLCCTLGWKKLGTIHDGNIAFKSGMLVEGDA